VLARLIVRALHAGADGLEGAPGPADVVIVLGGGLEADGSPGRTTLQRVRAGVRLWRAGIAPLVLFSGGCRRAGVSEAESMARVAEREGVPRDRVLLEASSQSTFENGRYSSALLRARGIARAVLVTSPSHLRRGVAVFRRAGVDVRGFVDPDAGAELYWAAREVVALGWYRLMAFI
jgi:uncharacterized SAM-binding protein YcdF (DUF218 family)